MTDNVDKLLSIAERFLAVNPEMCLTGSLMLELRGVDLGREAHDIDLLLYNYATNFITPEGMILNERGTSSDGTSAKYEFEGIIIDILTNCEEPEIVNGLKLGSVQDLVNQKYIYSERKDGASQKHIDDLIIIEYSLGIIPTNK